ncbi:glycerol-3-phosphate cytidylyltransferase [Bacillus sp. Bva_UNVM-123]|uniref:glycerol-3-phosphate cytidylyltransferase n=1 Tax=Bacillus sp. Bva_UNVM-123 TaxID=2829798 RepID=UPI00391F617D
MKKVITYGTFDLLHWGHVRLLERARGFGDHLTVALSTDDFNKLKRKKAYHSYEHRKYLLESLKYVDKVIPECNWEQKIADVIREEISMFVMGDDWKGEFDFLNPYCKVIYLPRTKEISSSKIKKDLSIR